MTRPRIGTVDHISDFASGDGQRLVTIDGTRYAVSVNLKQFPIVSGSQVEYVTAGNRADILAMQQELLPMPEAANLFNSNCTDCIGSAGDCSCLNLQATPAPAPAKAKRTDEYTGPFPRKRHSHRCLKCADRGQTRSVGCYKAHCTRPQTTETCGWCR